MKILIIEDDSFKAASLQSFLTSNLRELEITLAPSLVNAIDALEESEYSLILLDMAIPSHPTQPGEGAPMSLLTGGLEILMEIRAMDRQDPCVIITQYPEIEISGAYYSLPDSKLQLKKELDCDVVDCIEYSEGSKVWKQALGGILKKYENFNS